MSQVTKRALEASLKKLLLEKPLHKITVSDITDDCGINRMTFYYHFKDIYDLVEWSCQEDASRALAGKDLRRGSRAFADLEAVQENKPFILNVYRSISRGAGGELSLQADLRPAGGRGGGAGPGNVRPAGGQGLYRHAVQVYVRRPDAGLDADTT